jgi:hypothetical protein
MGSSDEEEAAVRSVFLFLTIPCIKCRLHVAWLLFLQCSSIMFRLGYLNWGGKNECFVTPLVCRALDSSLVC